jgi:hypothetical protein
VNIALRLSILAKLLLAITPEYLLANHGLSEHIILFTPDSYHAIAINGPT